MSSSGPAFPDPQTVGQVVADLRQDPVVVSTMMGGGDTARVVATLHAELARSTVPVHVVLTQTPAGLQGENADQQLASLVHAQLGQDGVYVVFTSQSSSATIAIYGPAYATANPPDATLSLARFAGEGQVEAAIPRTPRYGDHDTVSLAPATDAAIVLDLTQLRTLPEENDAVDRPVLTHAQVQALARAPWVEPGYVETDAAHLQPPSVGLSSLVAVAVGLGVAVVAYRLLRAASAWRRVPRPRARSRPVVDVEALRSRARTALADLERALDRSDDPRARLDGVRLERATGSRDAAALLVASEDPLDLVGARVLALAGAAALHPAAAPYRPCYVNPTHGAATTDARVAGSLDVPTCSACRRSVEKGLAPDVLLDARGKPYYEGRTVWARTGFGALDDDLYRRLPREASR